MTHCKGRCCGCQSPAQCPVATFPALWPPTHRVSVSSLRGFSLAGHIHSSETSSLMRNFNAGVKAAQWVMCSAWLALRSSFMFCKPGTSVGIGWETSAFGPREPPRGLLFPPHCQPPFPLVACLTMNWLSETGFIFWMPLWIFLLKIFKFEWTCSITNGLLCKQLPLIHIKALEHYLACEHMFNIR